MGKAFADEPVESSRIGNWKTENRFGENGSTAAALKFWRLERPMSADEIAFLAKHKIDFATEKASAARARDTRSGDGNPFHGCYGLAVERVLFL
jgi:hypothetical protein